MASGFMQEHPLEQARRWFSQASADCDIAARVFNEERYDLTLFLCQQSAEKAVKSLLIWYCGDFARTHVIKDLLGELRAANAPLTDRLAGLHALDAYYQSARCPDALGGAVPAFTFQREESELALQRVRKAISIVGEVLTDAASGGSGLLRDS
ncbi:MAG: HEPN domain-containing protein [Candidatus Eremiobacteraeota bacterium]|nr:HEPN domain-containing protein [Candidatus Eremiobacteraeota bacterium]